MTDGFWRRLTFGAGAAQDCPMLGEINGLLRSFSPVGNLALPSLMDKLENPRRRSIDEGAVDQALPVSFKKVLAPPPHRPRHFKVQTAMIRKLRDFPSDFPDDVPSCKRGNNAIGPKPVTHNEAVPAPLAPEDISDEVVVGRAKVSVYLVVSRHDRPRVAVADRDLERLEVDLAQGALGNLLVDEEAAILLVVGGVVLHTGPNSSSLDRLDVLGGKLARQERVLAVSFKVAPAQRGSWDANWMYRVSELCSTDSSGR